MLMPWTHSVSAVPPPVHSAGVDHLVICPLGGRAEFKRLWCCQLVITLMLMSLPPAHNVTAPLIYVMLFKIWERYHKGLTELTHTHAHAHAHAHAHSHTHTHTHTHTPAVPGLHCFSQGVFSLLWKLLSWLDNQSALTKVIDCQHHR